LLPADFEIKVLVLPGGQDPDDFVRQSGPEAYNAARGGAVAYLQFVLVSAMTGRSLTNPKHKADAIEEVLPLLAHIKNPIQRRDSFDQAMSYFRVEDRELRDRLWRSVRGSGEVEREVVQREVRRAGRAKITLAEQKLLELLVYDRELQDHIFPILEEGDFEHLATASVFRALGRLHAEGRPASLESLTDLIDDEDLSTDFLPILLMAENRMETGEAVDEALHSAENCVLSLRRMAISNHILEVSQELIAAEQTGDQALVARLVEEHLELSRIKQVLIGKIAES
jgi:DNA primase